METLNKVCIKISRIYRTLNKPILRSRVDAGFDLYPNDRAEKSLASLKIKDVPEIKLLDLILVLLAVKTVWSAVKSIMKIFD